MQENGQPYEAEPTAFELSIENLQQPDEDAREDWNLPAINAGIVKGTINRNKQVINEIATSNPILLRKIACRVRTQFEFMKSKVKICAV